MHKKKFIFFSIILCFMIALVVTFNIATSSDSESRTPSSIPEPYETLSAGAKKNVLWKKIVESEHKYYPAFKGFGLIELYKMSKQSIQHKSRNNSDFAPAGWIKYIHRHGSVAQVKFVAASDSSYTGLFKGAEHGLIRLSLTYRPEKNVILEKPVAPGLALKLFRDSEPSSNISALVSLNGQGHDYNFFSKVMSNIVPAGNSWGQKKVHNIFKRVSSYPEELVLKHFAQSDSTAKIENEPKYPTQIFFIPDENLNFSKEPHDVREDFAKIPEGTRLYKVHAVMNIEAHFNYSQNYSEEDIEKFAENSVHIGDIVTTSKFIASEFGDSELFFRHEVRP